jgi:hypothetical protein
MLLLDDRLKQLRRDGVPSRNFERRAPKNLETTPLQDDQACGSPLLTKREGAALGRRPAARPSAEPGRKLIRRGGKRRREELSGLKSSQRGDRVGCHPMPRFDSGSWRMQKFWRMQKSPNRCYGSPRFKLGDARSLGMMSSMGLTSMQMGIGRTEAIQTSWAVRPFKMAAHRVDCDVFDPFAHPGVGDVDHTILMLDHGRVGKLFTSLIF